jgi:signal transduction histidine kinase
MEEQTKSTAGQGLGIAGFVLGLVALIISFIPCVGLWALIPGILGIVFSAIALSQTAGTNASKGLIIAGLVLSIIGTSIATVQFFTFRTASRAIKDHGVELKEVFKQEFGKDFEEAREEAAEELKRIARELEGVAEEPEEPEEDSLKTEEEK